MRSDLAVRAVLVTGLSFFFAMVVVAPALAQTTSSGTGNLTSFLQNAVNLLNNGVTRLLAVLAIIITGAVWMIGHIDLRRAGALILGIIVTFGAATIVDMITGASGS